MNQHDRRSVGPICHVCLSLHRLYGVRSRRSPTGSCGTARGVIEGDHEAGVDGILRVVFGDVWKGHGMPDWVKPP
jgi:hypothetical protein